MILAQLQDEAFVVRLQDEAFLAQLQDEAFVEMLHDEAFMERLQDEAFVLSSLGVGHAQEFLRGDTNGDGIVSLADMVQLERSLFGNGGLPTCLEAADVNDDGKVNIVDSVDLVKMFFFAEALASAGEATTPGHLEAVPPLAFREHRRTV